MWRIKKWFNEIKFHVTAFWTRVCNEKTITDYKFRPYRTFKWIGLLVSIILRPRWIMNEDRELGIRIWGVNFIYYKWNDPLVCEPSTTSMWCYAKKREFGEVVTSQRIPELPPITYNTKLLHIIPDMKQDRISAINPNQGSSKMLTSLYPTDVEY